MCMSNDDDNYDTKLISMRKYYTKMPLNVINVVSENVWYQLYGNLGLKLSSNNSFHEALREK